MLLIWPARLALGASDQTFTEPFQNPTATLSGESVQTDLYFSREDYWTVKKAGLSLNFQISQLSQRQTSDITLALNGVKFASFRPSKASGLQTKQIPLPLKLLQGSNHLTIFGQIVNTKDASTLPQTPANWLTIYQGTNVNFQYQLQPPTPSVKSFYVHFTGMDTISGHNAAVVVPQNADDGELTAAAYALGGIARFITTTDTKLPITTKSSADYQLIVARYAHLPANLKKHVTVGRDQAVLQTYTSGKTHYLIVTADSSALLKRAAQFAANQELMQETKASREAVTKDTQVFTSVLQYQGKVPFSKAPTTLTGTGHHSATFFVNVPTDRNNANGSLVRLHFRYAKNLDFKQSLATISINGQQIGSKHLSESHADDDTLTVKLPKGLALANTFTVSVGFDLETGGNQVSSQTPWAQIQPDSQADVRSTPEKQLLFNNFPSTFIQNQGYADVLLVRPQQMTASDYATLTNLMNLLGSYVQTNTGRLSVTQQRPGKAVQQKASVIAFGTPKQNPLIAQLNPQLYFRFRKDQGGFLSNEKLSIEKTYGQTIGTAQLLRAPANAKHALLVVTGATPQAANLASTQVSTRAAVSQYSGDAIVVDPDNLHYSYRFKKVAAVSAHPGVKKTLAKNSQILIYLAVGFGAIALIILATFWTLRKHTAKKGGQTHA